MQLMAQQAGIGGAPRCHSCRFEDLLLQGNLRGAIVIKVDRAPCCSAADFLFESYGEDKGWPEDYKDWVIRTVAWDEMKDYVVGLRALRDALQEEDKMRGIVYGHFS